MHKVRISQNNYQLVAESSGQSPEVLMSNYNEALDSEKRDLSRLVESDLYPAKQIYSDRPSEKDFDTDLLLQKIRSDPDFSRELMQLLLRSAENDV